MIDVLTMLLAVNVVLGIINFAVVVYSFKKFKIAANEYDCFADRISNKLDNEANRISNKFDEEMK